MRGSLRLLPYEILVKRHFPEFRPLVLYNQDANNEKQQIENRFSFLDNPFINPAIIQHLLGCISDPAGVVVSINLLEGNTSNQFFEGSNPIVETNNNRRWIKYTTERRESFSYSLIGVSESGIYILYCIDYTGGSGIFHTVIFLSIQHDTAIYYDDSEETLSSKARQILKYYGSFSLGDRYDGDVSYIYPYLRISADKGYIKARITSDICLMIK